MLPSVLGQASSGLGSSKKQVLLTGRGAIHNNPSTGLSGTSQQSSTSRIFHPIYAGGNNIRLVYAGIYQGGGAPTDAETPAPNAYMIRASLEKNPKDGTIYPVTFGGQTSVVVYPKSIVISDPIPIEVYASDNFLYTRTYVQVSAGQQWPYSHALIPVSSVIGDPRYPFGEGKTDGSDLTLAGTVGVGSGDGYGPIAIIGTPTDPTMRVVGGLGDSILWGQSGADGFIRGYFDIELHSLGLPHWNGGRQAEQATQQKNRGVDTRYFILSNFCTDCILESGFNDLTVANRNSDQIIADRRRLADSLAGAGVRVWPTTLMPHAQSSDYYSTLTGQTIPSATVETYRQAVSADAKSGYASYAGYIDLESLVKTTNAGGDIIWKFNASLRTSHGTGAGGANTMVDSTIIGTEAHINQTIKITGGTGSGQVRSISGVSAGLYTVSVNWITPPDATSTYQVLGNITWGGLNTAGPHPTTYGHTYIAGQSPMKLALGLAQQPAALYNPLDLVPSLWVTSANLPVAASLATWTDLSGNEQDLLQATGAFQPSVILDGGKPTVRMTNAQFMKTAAGGTYARGMSVWIVFKLNTLGLAGVSDQVFEGFNNGTLSMQTRSVGTFITDGAGGIGIGTPVCNGVYGAVLAVFSHDASGALYLNGTLLVSGDTGINFPTLLTLGASNDGSVGADVSIREGICIPRILTTAEIAALHGYSQVQWGTP